MAFFNEIGAGRFNRGLQKLFNMKGGPPSRSLGSDIMPVVPFEDSESVELRWIHQWNRYGITMFSPAVAAKFSAIQIRNPLNSNTVAVLEKLAVTAAGIDAVGPTVSFQQVIGTDLLTVVGPVKGFDARNTANPVCITTRDQLAAVTSLGDASIWGFPLATAPNGDFNAILTANQEIPLMPGSAIRVQLQTANIALFTCFFWRERGLEDSEAVFTK